MRRQRGFQNLARFSVLIRPDLGQRQRQLHARRTWRALERLPIPLRSFERLADTHLGIGEIDDGLHVGRVLRGGLFVLRDRSLILSLPVEDDAQTELCKCVAAVHCERCFEFALRFVQPPQIGVRNTEVGKRLRTLGVCLDRGLERRLGQIETPGASEALTAAQQRTRRRHLCAQRIGHRIDHLGLDTVGRILPQIVLGLGTLAHALIGHGQGLPQPRRRGP